jgi:hypothetical protein
MDYLTNEVNFSIGQGEAYLKFKKVLPSRFFSEELRTMLKLPAE